MNYVYIVALLAVAQYFAFGILVGIARERHKISAPAVSGNELFDAAFRVHMNTLEQLAGFLPTLLIASIYWPEAVVSLIGTVYLVGRQVYRRGYLKAPAKRQAGFLLTVIPIFLLFGMALAGALGADSFMRH